MEGEQQDKKKTVNSIYGYELNAGQHKGDEVAGHEAITGLTSTEGRVRRMFTATGGCLEKLNHEESWLREEGGGEERVHQGMSASR